MIGSPSRVRQARAVAVLVLVLGSACGTAPEPVPFRGPRPESVLVVPARPLLDLTEPARLDRAFASMLRDRGFRVPPVDDANRLLEALDWKAGRASIDEVPVDELRSERGLEAVWVTEVEQWEFERAPGYPIVFAVRCSILSTEDRSLLWTCYLQGEQRTARSQTVINPLADPEPFESDHPFFYERVHEVLGDEDLFELVARAFGLRLPEE